MKTDIVSGKSLTNFKRRMVSALAAFALMTEAGAGAGAAAEWPSGFDGAVSPAERDMAERPQPDEYFREMIRYWNGVPGLEALRERWQGFGGGEPGFAVLAALVSEAEGRPEEALEKLHGLQDSRARWNEGRLLALLGREKEAVEVLEPLTEAQQPEIRAAALIALTERDCVRGNFAGALRRTGAAWAVRQEEEFLMRTLERHLSLLVQAGREQEFIKEQIRLADALRDEEAVGKVRHLLAVMSDWFPQNARLQEARQKLEPEYATVVAERAAEGRSPMLRNGRLWSAGF